jgi:hypothetical protein
MEQPDKHYLNQETKFISNDVMLLVCPLEMIDEHSTKNKGRRNS